MTPKEETLKFIEKKTQKEQDKWEVGGKINFYHGKVFWQTFKIPLRPRKSLPWSLLNCTKRYKD